MISDLVIYRVVWAKTRIILGKVGALGMVRARKVGTQGMVGA